jgi:SsrA-binding protein
MSQADSQKIIARNRKALKDYEIRQTIEAGIELLGCEVKSLREGKINIADAYAYIERGQVWLKNLHISPYKMATGEPPDPLRTRRLLLHKREIRKITALFEQRGMAIVPLNIYFKGNLVKIELGIGVGRKKYDKRQAIAKAEAQRRMDVAMKRNSR